MVKTIKKQFFACMITLALLFTVGEVSAQDWWSEWSEANSAVGNLRWNGNELQVASQNAWWNTTTTGANGGTRLSKVTHKTLKREDFLLITAGPGHSHLQYNSGDVRVYRIGDGLWVISAAPNTIINAIPSGSELDVAVGVRSGNWRKIANFPPLGHDVTFDLDGGNGGPTPNPTKVTELATSPTPIPTKDGFVFSHWSLTKNGTAITFKLNITEPITIYAVWTPIYNVTFDLDGGDNGPWADDYKNLTSITELPEPTPTKDGHDFVGWSLTRGGAQLTYPYPLAGHTTLYALWVSAGVTLPKVTFDCGTGATGCPVTINAAQSPLQKPAATPTRTKHEFLHWSLTQNGADMFIGGSYTFNENNTPDFTIYAVWREITQVTFDCGEGATGCPATINDPGAQLLTSPKAPTHLENDFRFWSLSQGGPSVKFPLNITGDIKLYAVWLSKGGNTCDDYTIIGDYDNSRPSLPFNSGVYMTRNGHLFRAINGAFWSWDGARIPPNTATSNSEWTYILTCAPKGTAVAPDVMDFTVNLNDREYTGATQPAIASGYVTAPARMNVTILYRADGAVDWVENAPRNVGKYAIAAFVTANEAYSGTGFNPIVLGNINIIPKAVNIVWGDNPVYNGQLQKPTATIAGVGSDGTITLDVSGGQTAVGTGYSATAVIPAPHNGNYTLNNNATTFGIAKRPMAIKWDKTAFTYNGNPQGSIASFVDEFQIVLSEDVKVKTTGTGTNAGNHSATAELDGDNMGNYIISSGNTTQAFVINPIVLDIEWTIAPAGYTYDGEEQSPTPSISPATPIVGGENVYFDWTKKISAGAYEVVATLVGTDVKSNYELHYSTTIRQNYTIEKRILEIGWIGTGAEYEYNGTEQSPEPYIVNDDYIVFGDENDIELDWTSATNAGKGLTVTVSLVGDKAHNYNIEDGFNILSHTYDINPYPVTITWDWEAHSEGAPYEYNGTEQGPKAVSATALPSFASGVTVGTIRATDAGSHNAEATFNGGGTNFVVANIADMTKSFVINPMSLNVIWTPADATYTYDGSEHGPTPSFNGAPAIVGTDGVGVINSTKNINANTDDVPVYTAIATITGTKAGNYTLASGETKTFRINPRPLTATWGTVLFEYNGTEQHTTATYDIHQISPSERDAFPSTVTYSGSKRYVGNYEVTVATSNTNYHFTTVTESKNFEITPAPVNVNWGNTSFEYSGAVPQFNATIAPKFAGDDVDVEIETDLGNEIDKGNAYGATAILVGTHKDNYYINLNGTGNFDITAKEITLNWQNFVNGKVELEYTGQPQTPEATPVGLVEGESIVLTYTNLQRDIKTDGNYSTTASIVGNNNYEIANADVDFVILPRTLTIAWSNATLTYNKSEQSPEPSITGGKIGNDDVAVILASNKETNVGSYSATAELDGDDAGNYRISAGPQSFVIAPKPLTITWSTTPLAYNGAEQAPIPSIAGGIETGDVVTVSVVSGKKTNAGSVGYLATAELAGTDADNYTIGSGEGKAFVINKKMLDITWSGGTSFIYNGANQGPKADFDANGIEAGDNAELLLTGAGKNAGNYTMTAEFTGNDADNYEISSTSDFEKNFVITPKEITVVWTNTSFEYNGEPRNPTATITSGGVIGADVVNLTYTPGQKNAGNYTATATASNNNYVISDASKTQAFNITKKSATVVWNAETLIRIVDGLTQQPTATVTGLADADKTAALIISGGKSAVGIHIATAALPADIANNYDLGESYLTTFEIKFDNPSAIFAGKGQQRIYGIAFVENIVKSGETAKFTISVPEAANVKLAIYDIMGNSLNSQDLKTNSSGDANGTWNTMNSAGRYVAAGTYLVVVEAKGVSGKTYRYTAKLGIVK